VDSSEDGHSIYCGFEDMNDVSKALEAVLGEAESVKSVWKPQNTIPVDEEKAQSLMKLIGNLEDDDDVQNVYTNFEVSDELMAKLSA
jgi:transcriptional/translational regulatory protein YebC/TACO1